MRTLENFRFSPQTRDRVYANVERFQEKRQLPDGLRRAAVAVTVLHHEGEAAVIVTRRSHKLKAHRGQWALPGGGIDEGENAVGAALRELEEEINLSVDESDVVGTLDDYLTRSGYLITPVVVWADVECCSLKPNPEEVASIHAFSFRELSRTDSPLLETIPQSDRQVLSIHYGDSRIFAPTAAVLYQFREVAIRGKSTRVLHYDQPVFAWK